MIMVITNFENVMMFKERGKVFIYLNGMFFFFFSNIFLLNNQKNG
jgi:hypothetical protein